MIYYQSLLEISLAKNLIWAYWKFKAYLSLIILFAYGKEMSLMNLILHSIN